MRPEDTGQIVTDSWTAIADHGAICWTYDASDRTSTYRLHKWTKDGVFEPWNGHIGARKRGRKITEEEARRLIEDARA